MFFSLLIADFLSLLIRCSILYQTTVALVQQLVAILVGIIVVVLVKLALVCLCRCALYRAFYRKSPASANLVSLSLECANFALSVGFVSLRMVKLLLTSALYVGRIDTFFLARDVGRVGGFEIDGYPRIFIRDILSHEAHR